MKSKHMRRARTAASVLVALSLSAGLSAGLSGCYESSEVVSHEPGEFKGAADPLASNADERAQALRERFSLVQTDR